MQRLLINTINCALLIIIWVGVPAITHAQFWNWQISSSSTAQKLMFGGLVFAIVINVLGAILFIPGPKAKALCAKWVFIFTGLLFAEYAYIQGWINFNWLKDSLRWLQNHL
jgi:hypothetical protein